MEDMDIWKILHMLQNCHMPILEGEKYINSVGKKGLLTKKGEVGLGGQGHLSN